MRLTSDLLFKAVTGGLLLFLVLLLAGVLVSIAYFTDLGTLLSAFLSDEVLFAVKLSLLTATAATVISLGVTVPAAYALSRSEFPGKGLVDTLLNVPIVLSPIALGVALLIFFSNTPIGVVVESSLLKFVFEVPGLVLAQFTVVSALAIRIMKSTFDGLDPRYENMARILGCNKFQAFFRVTLPLSKNGLVAAAVLAWARALGEFGATVTLAGAVRMKTETLPIAIFLSLATADVAKATAVILILLGVAVVVLIATQRVMGRRFVF
ncbi:MAG: ABC transporter permease [Candidatus Bathyarchaeia archaeon]